MQVQKTEIRKTILEVAKAEFFEKGYKSASMRTIAKNTGVGLSNIYNYFKNKNEIFNEVLTPLLCALNKIREDHNDNSNITVEIFTSEKYLQEQINMFVNLITRFKRELKLLLFHAHGSELENYKDDYINRHTEMGIHYMELMKDKYPSINSDISAFFIHTISSWWIAIISELASHDLSDSQIETFVSEYMAFGIAGWQRLMKV